MLALADPDSNFVWQAVLTIAAALHIVVTVMKGLALRKELNAPKPKELPQPLQVAKHDEAAKRSELLRIETTLKSFGERVDGLAEQINAQFAAMSKAGQDRAAAITESIDTEISQLQTKIGTLAEALHEKINKAVVDNARQGSDIAHLQSEAFRHTSEIAAIRAAIQDLLKNGGKKH